MVPLVVNSGAEIRIFADPLYGILFDCQSIILISDIDNGIAISFVL